MRSRIYSGLVLLAVVPGLVAAAEDEKPAAKAEKPAARAFLGIALEPTAKDAAHAGALVRDVMPNSPAARAGLKAGDVITRLQDKEVKEPKTVIETVAQHKAGDKLTLHFWRDGKEQTAEVTAGEQAARSPFPRPMAVIPQGIYLGVHAQDITPELKTKLGVTADKGAVVMDVMPDSPAAKAGLKVNDVITGVNDQAVANAEELRNAVRKAGAGKEATLKVTRGKENMEVKVKLPEMPLGFRGLQGMLPQFDKEMPRRFEDLEKMLRDFEKSFELEE
jgi:serine protease Do